MAADIHDTASSPNLTKHPIVIALAVAAALGWIVVIWSLIASGTQEQALTGRIQQLEELRRTGGTLLDLQDQITTAQQNLEQLRVQQEQAVVSLAQTRNELGPAEQRLSDLQGQIEARTAEVNTLQGEAESLAGRLEQTRQELSRLTASSAEKVSQLADAERRLQQAQEQSAAVQRQLAQLINQLTARRSELMAIDQRLQGGRSEASATQSIRRPEDPAPMNEGQIHAPTDGSQRELGCEQTASGWVCAAPQAGTPASPR
jgi:DNA repair exonuclease SbcCD ATPase subunit